MNQEKEKPVAVLKIDQLSKNFDRKPALQGISLELSKGEIYGLLGPNGAGKTTTLKILAGLLSPDNGRIYVNNTLYERHNMQIKKKIAYVPDQPFVYTKLTGEEHLHFFADLYKIPHQQRQEKFDFYFNFFEFTANRHELVESYSQGTRQKLLITQALMVDPLILLLDEPMVSIDPLVGRKFKKLLKETANNGTTVLFATHILSLAQEVSQRIGIIINGKIICQGDLKQLLQKSGGQNLEDFYFNTVSNYENPF